jgi:hypothetical protein
MHTHPHHSGSPVQTEGRLVPWASFYDATVNLMTFGQTRRLRQMTVDQAQLKPGEKVLDVGLCKPGHLAVTSHSQLFLHRSMHIYAVPIEWYTA